MKQYKLQELVGNTKRLPFLEKLFYEKLISFRKLPECAELFLPLQLQNRLKTRKRESSSSSRVNNYDKHHLVDRKRQCSRDDEEVQSYAEWKYFISWTKLSSLKQFRRFRKSIIYVLPIGPFPEGILSSLVSPHQTFLQALTTFGEAYFPGICFKILPEIDFKEMGCNTRLHKKTGQLQLLLPDVMSYLSSVLPKNAIGIVGLSWIDFYPGDDWNHILGEGSAHSGCAAISFAHYALYTEVQSIVPSGGRKTSNVTTRTSENASEISFVSHDDFVKASDDFKDNRFPKSLLNETNIRKAASCMSLNSTRKSSSISIGGLLTRSSSSYKYLGSLSSIENSWTKVFSPSSANSYSNLSIDDASYDIINKGEAQHFLDDHGMEEDVIKLALPVGSSFNMSCTTMWRLFKAITHEVCHVFGLSHCSFYECAMNSSRFVSEVDEQPLFLCPICLRKLQKFLKFTLIDRYRRIDDILRSMRPCYVENISLSRNHFDEIADEELCHISEGDLCGGADIVHQKSSHVLIEHDSSGLICIEVTHEKNEGYDIINLEYKQRRRDESGYEEDHQCHMSEALDKLGNIISFLNRH